MIAVLVAGFGLQLVLLGFVVWSVVMSRPGTESEREPLLVTPPSDNDLNRRVETLERRWDLLLEDLDERIERGNKAWRRVRASERRQQERDEGEEIEESDEDLPLFHGNGSADARMPSVHHDLGHPEPHREFARQIARQIALNP